MKKILMFLMGIMLMICMSSCNSCSKQSDASSLTDSTVVELVVENTIATDRQAMYLNHSENYRWFETGVQLNDWLDEDCDGSFNLVVNVFQVVEEIDSTSFDTYVVKIQHIGEDVIEESVHGFWIEDYPLNDDSIVITFKQAFERVQAVNLPKPHTHQVVLRKMVGPVEANPQWIFGNLHSQIYVDAITGEVSDENPAFKGCNLNKPLGEWP